MIERIKVYFSLSQCWQHVSKAALLYKTTWEHRSLESAVALEHVASLGKEQRAQKTHSPSLVI